MTTDRYELYIIPDFNFIHWVRNEPNRYKGYKFWKYFSIKRTKISEKGISVDFFEFSEEGKPKIAYHYFNDKLSLNNAWNFGPFHNFEQAWHFLDVPQFYTSYTDALNTILELYNKKVQYTCGQYMS